MVHWHRCIPICTTQVWRTCYMHCTMYNRFNVFCRHINMESVGYHCGISVIHHNFNQRWNTVLLITYHHCKYSLINHLISTIFCVSSARPSIIHSQAVTHPSTNPDQYCLTSVIGREQVHSAWYGRKTLQHIHKRPSIWKQCQDGLYFCKKKAICEWNIAAGASDSLRLGSKEKGICSPTITGQKDLQHWVFPHGHP